MSQIYVYVYLKKANTSKLQRRVEAIKKSGVHPLGAGRIAC